MKNSSINNSGANLGFEEKLWQTANSLRSKVDPSDYKYVIPGLLFLKYASSISDQQSFSNKNMPMFEDDNIYVPADAHWKHIKENLYESSLASARIE